MLGFIVSQGRREQYLPRLVRGKPPQRYECLNELRVAYYLNSMGFRIEDWDSIGSNDTRGEFTISVDGENAIFVEVKSPGWEGTLNRNEINRGRAREPKYLESEGIHRIKPNWEDVRKSVDGAYRKFSPDRANLLVIADDFFMPLDNRQMQIALLEPLDGQYGPGCFASLKFPNLGGVMAFINETTRLEFSDEVQAVPRYGHLFYANPCAFNRTLEKWIQPEEKPKLRRVRREICPDGLMTGQTTLDRAKLEPSNLTAAPRDTLRMTTATTLGPNSHAGCPACGRRIAFFSGAKDAFMSEERCFAADSALQLECPLHGKFEVIAAEFITEVPRRL